MPTIHGVNASPFVRKVRVAMLEKGLDYDLEPVMPIGVSDEFKKLSPLGKIPVYQDGDFVLPGRALAPSWPEAGPSVAWQRAIGKGYSAIVVDGGVLYTLYRRDEQEVVVALDTATGEPIWRIMA